MKKCFIGMSINKQLYFGIFGICALFGGLCLFLILLASTKLFFSYNIKIKSVFNEIDTNIVSLNGENADLFGQLLLNQGKFETFLLRRYFNTLYEEFGKDLLNYINIDETEINKHFQIGTTTQESCGEENSKCFFVFSDNGSINDLTKKILYFLMPIIDISLETHSFNKDNFLIFNKFNFFEKENNAFISYKYNKNDIEKNFDSTKSASNIMNNVLLSFLGTKNLIEKLNNIKINEITNYKCFKENIYTIFPSFSQGIFIDPYYKNLSRTFHFGSFQFNKNEFNDNENVNLEKINLNNLENYLTFDINVDYLSVFTLNLIRL